MSRTLEKIEHAEVNWNGDAPINATYDDVYWSRDGAIDEARLVFLEANDIEERLTRDHLRVGETGFGAGLNFILTWMQAAATDCHLEYFAVEQHPPSPADHAKLLEWVGLTSPHSKKLLERLPDRVPGWHRIDLSPQCRLWLGYGDGQKRFSELTTTVDAWYLDGHASGKNPDLWNDAILNEIRRLSGPGTTFGTWSATGDLRRSMTAVGFDVQRLEGFGNKIHRLTGRMPGTSAQSEIPKSCVVIGAGLAGSHVARALASAGCKVTVLDPLGPGRGTSSNPAGIHKPLLHSAVTEMSQAALTAFGLGRRLIADLVDEGHPVNHSFKGTLQSTREDKRDQRVQSAITTHNIPETVLQWVDNDTSRGGFFPKGGWISPQELCAALCQHDNIEVKNHTVNSLDDDLLQAADAVVVATGHLITDLAGRFPAEVVRGQLHLVANMPQPDQAISTGGGIYVIPLPDHNLVGASFEKNDLNPTSSEASKQTLLTECRQRLPKLDWPSTFTDKGRVGFRTFMGDHRPIAGLLPDRDQCAALTTNTRYDLKDIPRSPRLWAIGGLGSRGLLWAPWLADIISRQICNGPTFDLDRAVDPARFIRREIASGHTPETLRASDNSQ